MSSRMYSVLALASVVALTTAAVTSTRSNRPSPDGLTVHEWGTFTTVAGEDGRAVNWFPLGGPTDLPCFVERFQNQSAPQALPGGFGSLLVGKVAGVTVTRNTYAVNGVASYSAGSVAPQFDYEATRANVRAKVRMETPVLYFYSPSDVSVNVRVDFPRGLMTEWYPTATVTQGDVGTQTLSDPSQVGTIEWKDVRVTPNAQPAFLAGSGTSRYFEARATDASPLAVGGEAERFLFYRGVANFDVPLSAALVKNEAVRITSLGSDAIPGVVLFERRGDSVGFRVHGAVRGDVTLDAPSMSVNSRSAADQSLASLRSELERMLESAGLYPKEAAAMVATWRDSWFEDGVRVFYILPASAMSAILPLKVDPAPLSVPLSVTRVFVGRMEVVTPETEWAVQRAVSDNDAAALEPYARFFGPIADRILADPRTAGTQQRFRDVANGLLAAYVEHSSSCN
ncbi:MAG TPA: hypothetical protein VMH39_15135 [Gemmatimonadaceae bacterium]|nr:hypothetical protein [Gemmatimonadaceae bacterium]